VRPGGAANAQMNAKDIRNALINELGYFELNLQILLRDEMERKTELGKELVSLNSAGKMITEDLKTRLLKKVIYSGNDKNKFIMNSWPETKDDAYCFES
jgi:adenylate kinase family enzyme